MKPLQHYVQNSRRTMLACLVGTLLYAGLSLSTYFINTGDSLIAANVRPGVAVPIFFGFVFGPLVGFLVGFCGNLLGDTLLGFISLDLSGSLQGFVAGLILNWQVGNGLIGLVAGFGGQQARRYQTRGALLWAALVSLLAVTIGIGFAVFLDPWAYPDSYPTPATVWRTVLWESFLPITIANAISGMVLVPLVLFDYRHLDLRVRDLWRSVMMRRILLTIVMAAAVPTILLSLFLIEAYVGPDGNWLEAVGKASMPLIMIVLPTIALVIVSAAMITLSVTGRLLNLSRAARAMEQGRLSLAAAAALRETRGDDEITRLSHTFGTMACEVIQREEELQRRVQDLQIKIDGQKQRDQVREIVETDFFRDLKHKARTMRERGKPQLEAVGEQAV